MKNVSLETKQLFEAWWKGDKVDAPLVSLVGNTGLDYSDEFKKKYANISNYDLHLSPEYRCDEMEQRILRTKKYYGQAFPFVDLNIGPGSLSTYFGCEPEFNPDTIWYNALKCDELSEILDIEFIQKGGWWEKHVDIIQKAVKRADGRYYIGIPDIQEGMDIVSAIRHPSELCIDMIDCPEDVFALKEKIDKAFYPCFDKMYDIVKDPADGFNCFTAFHIIGKGMTGKIQCDYSALISPDMFNEYSLPELTKQADYLENSLYHLDGPDAIRHLDSVLTMKNLNALQWVAGAGQNDPASDEWLFIYDKVKEAGKSLWISIYDGSVDRWIEKAKMLIKRYGTDGLYLIFGDTDVKGAEKIAKELKINPESVNFEL